MAVCAALASAGCRGPDQGLRVAARWAPDDSHELFAPERLLEPAGPELPVRCVPTSDPERPDLPELTCRLPVAAPAPAQLELELDGANLSRWRVFAGGRAEPATVAEPVPGAPGLDQYRVRLEQSDSAEPLVLRPIGAATTGVRVVRAGLRGLARAEPLAEAAVGRPWKLEAGGEWRTGVPALPGHPVVWALPDPPAPGLVETAIAGPEALEFRLTLEQRTGSSTLFAGGATKGWGGWTPIRAPLPPGTSCPCRLRLEVSGADSEAWGAWAEPLLLARGARRPALALLSLDTVRADRLGPYGGPAQLTPFLDGLAAGRAELYERAVPTATWTLPSHWSILSGLEAFEHPRSLASESSAGRIDSGLWLPALLRSAGYRTVAVTAGGFVHPRFGFALGFDEYLAVPFEADPDHELEMVVSAALEKLARLADQPVFLFFHTYEAHAPNRLRDSSRLASVSVGANLVVEGRLGTPDPATGFVGSPGFTIRDRASGAVHPAGPEDVGFIVEAYDRALAHLDDQLALLFGSATQLAPGAGSLIVVTSDHGEALGEHGRMSHALLDEANCRIPLLVAWPSGQAAGTRSDRLVSLVDLAPTFLAAAGLEIPERLSGTPLAPGDPPAGRSRAWTYVASNNQGLALHLDHGRKLIWRDGAWAGTGPRARLVDPGRDPAEVVDFGASEPATGRWLLEARSALSRNLRGLRVSVTNHAAEEVSLELRHPAIQPGATKLLDADAELEWIRPGRARAILPPGGHGDWILIEARSDRVDLEATLRMGSGAGATLRLHDARRRGLAVAAAAPPGGAPVWYDHAVSDPLVSIVLEARGHFVGTADLVTDGELESQLRALGYLE